VQVTWERKKSRVMENSNIKKSGLFTGTNRRKLVVHSFALLLGALLLNSPTCLAQTTTVTREPFETCVAGPNLPSVAEPGECPEINWPLCMNGTSQNVITDTVRKGVHYQAIHNLITGTAIDGLGNEFKFQYVLNFRTSVSESSGEEFVNFATDMFIMHGPAGNLSIGFIASLHFTEDGSFLGAVPYHAHGNWVCDAL
jgi:hypothetical protein